MNAAEAVHCSLPAGVGVGSGGGKTTWRPRRPRNLSHLSASVMSSFCGDWATCYSLCDTNILHYTLRHWDYWTSLSRPSLTRWLITWFLFTKYLKSNGFLTRLLEYPHALKWREEQRKDGLLVKSVACGPQVVETQVEATGELSGKRKRTSEKRTSAERREAWNQREHRKCRVGFLTQLKRKCRPSCPGIPKIINTKIKQ